MTSAVPHPPYAMTTRRSPGAWYALAFALCMAIIALAFLFAIQHGWFLIQVPEIAFKLPDLKLAELSTGNR